MSQTALYPNIVPCTLTLHYGISGGHWIFYTMISDLVIKGALNRERGVVYDILLKQPCAVLASAQATQVGIICRFEAFQTQNQN